VDASAWWLEVMLLISAFALFAVFIALILIRYSIIFEWRGSVVETLRAILKGHVFWITLGLVLFVYLMLMVVNNL
jgi:hypothetical protein